MNQRWIFSHHPNPTQDAMSFLVMRLRTTATSRWSPSKTVNSGSSCAGTQPREHVHHALDPMRLHKFQVRSRQRVPTRDVLLGAWCRGRIVESAALSIQPGTISGRPLPSPRKKSAPGGVWAERTNARFTRVRADASNGRASTNANALMYRRVVRTVTRI